MAITQTHSLDLEQSSTEYVTIADASQTGLDFTTAMTLEGWFKFESKTSPLRSFFSKYGSAGNYSYYFYYDVDSTHLGINLSANGSTVEQEISSTFNPTLGVWYHLAVTYDGGAGEVKFYVDGSQLGTTQTTSIASLKNSNESFAVGILTLGGSNLYSFDGLVKDARAWSVVRTQTEINDNKDNCNLSSSETGLEGWWAFNNNYLDETANNNDLTAVNTPTFVTDLPYTCAAPGTPFVPKVSMIN